MPNLNRVFLMGNLTRDPEVRYTPKGSAIANLGLAVNRVYSTESGEKKEEVTFVDIEAWGKQAEAIGRYLAKGRSVFVEGRLKLDTWEDKESKQKRSRLKVVAERVEFLGGPKGAEPREGEDGGGERPSRSEFSDAREGTPLPAANQAPPAAGGAGADDDNLPF